MKANRAAGEQNIVIVEGWVLVSLLSCLHPQISTKACVLKRWRRAT